MLTDVLDRSVTAGRTVLDRLRPRRPGEASQLDEVAEVAERLAALLSAGLAPAAAWRALAEAIERGEDGDGDSGASSRVTASLTAGRRPRPRGVRRGERAGRGAAPDLLVSAARSASAGEPVADALESTRLRVGAHPAWSVLAAAWAVADAAGAPLARSLAGIASALRDEAQSRREATSMLAGPAASARLVAALPVIAVAFGSLLGFDTVGVLVGGPVGLACLVTGGTLLWAGARWNRALVRRAGADRPADGLRLELVAVALAGGIAPGRARRLVAGAVARHLPELGGHDPTGDLVAVAERAGAPVAELLRTEAARRRGAARAAAAARAATLGVRLMIPLGCCVLPAFVLLGVAPLMLSVVAGTLGAAS
ncbi:type II secretion system F family protein [Agromyces sp. SYSU T0242]|uniref:type II secretion system F family protein n=1 Tax=Agromyces litoreus TaxID=3158561 RepID=UPI003398DE5C